MNLSDPIIHLFSILFAGSMIHGFFLSFLVFSSSYDKHFRILLGTTLLLLSLWILNYLLYTTGWIIQWPHLLDVCIPFLYMVGPMLYFIARRISPGEYRYQIYDLIHLIPFGLILINAFPEYALGTEEKLELINQIFENQKPSIRNVIWVNKLNILTLVYGLYALHLNTKNPSDHPFQTTFRATLKIIIAILLAKIIVPIILIKMDINAAYVELFMVFLLAGIIHSTAYFYFKSLKISPIKSMVSPPPENGKYQTSPLNKEEIKVYIEQIHALFHAQQPWKDPGYSMDDLALQLKIPKHHLSQVINEGLGVNFYDLINKVRIEEVIRRLESGDYVSYSIGGIGSDCGFNSPSTFHRAFKKYTETTPTAYIKKLI